MLKVNNNFLFNIFKEFIQLTPLLLIDLIIVLNEQQAYKMNFHKMQI